MALLLALWPLVVNEEYVFVPSDKTPAVLQVMNKTSPLGFLQHGYIDENGIFNCERSTDLTALFRNAKHPVPEPDPELLAKRRFEGKVTHAINMPRVAGESVYEYRCGKLVMGYLSKSYQFIPETGEKIIDFADYQFSERAIRIYNLPGKFVKLSEFRKQQEANK